MTTPHAAAPDGGPAGSTAGGPAGRVDVKERVLRRVAEEASAEVIGVSRDDIQVEVAEYRNGIALRIAAPLPIPALSDTAAIDRSPTVLEQAARIQQDLRDRAGRLLGRPVTRVNLTVTGAQIPESRRVR